MKRALRGGLFAAAALFGGLALIPADLASAQATQICPDNTGGYGPKVNYSGGGNTTVVTAPDGKLISGYCVKAGSDTEQSGGGVSFVTVDPPAKTVTIDHPTKDSISHYSLKLVDAPPPPPPPPPGGETTTTATAGAVAEQAGPVPTAPAAPTNAATPAAAAPAPTQLPATGTSSWVTALIALAALAGGTTLVRVSRRPTD